jgi:hypothetical protein
LMAAAALPRRCANAFGNLFQPSQKGRKKQRFGSFMQTCTHYSGMRGMDRKVGRTSVCRTDLAHVTGPHARRDCVILSRIFAVFTRFCSTRQRSVM